MKPIIIYGSGGHAKVVIDIIEKSAVYSILGLIDDHRRIGETIFGYDVLGTPEESPLSTDKIRGGLVAIGDNFKRAQCVERLLAISPAFNFVAAIHPAAMLARGVTIGDGSVVMAGAVINSDTNVGRHCIVNTNASIDHDCTLSDFSALFPNTALAGNVSLGCYSTIAIGANIAHGITIGENSLIGAGSTVIKSIPSNCTAYGTPCKVIRPRKYGENFLS